MDSSKRSTGRTPRSVTERPRPNLPARSTLGGSPSVSSETSTELGSQHYHNTSESISSWTSAEEVSSPEGRTPDRHLIANEILAARGGKRPRLGMDEEASGAAQTDEGATNLMSTQMQMNKVTTTIDQLPQRHLPPIQPSTGIYGSSPTRKSSRADVEGASYGRSTFDSTKTAIQPPSPSFNLPPIGSITRGHSTVFSGHSPSTPLAPQIRQDEVLQEVRTQLASKQAASQRLQSEHDQLLAAFSKLQSKSDVLEKRSQVADREISVLSDEKLRLQQQLQISEKQVAELSKTKAELQKQGTADGAQWRQIMAMSTQLQTRSSEETRRFNAEREQWGQERVRLKQRIEELEKGFLALPSRGDGPDHSEEQEALILASNDLDMLRSEVIRLMRRCRGIEALHSADVRDADEMDQAVKLLSDARQRIIGRRQPE